MKKYWIWILILFILILPVNAASSKLYFTSSGDRLYYDSNKFNKDMFMNYDKMIPGEVYDDELIIENDSDTDYVLFFQVIEKQGQDDLANELLDNITMKLYLDDKLIYDGYAKGLDYNDSKIDLQNVIRLGEFKKGYESRLKVEVSLLPSYSNLDSVTSYIDWSFYGYYDDEVKEIVPNPDTNDEGLNNIILFSLSLIGIVCILLVLLIRRRKNDMN